MRDMLGGSYTAAVRATILPEWLSMNAVMAGMIPVMTILMSRDMRAMQATSLRFWGVMSLATLAGALLALPINWWLVAKNLKHGMGTERIPGKGGARTAAPISRDPSHDSMPGMVMAQPMPSTAGMQIKATAPRPTGAPVDSVPSGAGLAERAHTMEKPAVPLRQKFLAAVLTMAMLGAGIAVAQSAGAFALPSSQGGMAMP